MTRRPVPYVPQMEVAECGLASLAMILGHHGAHVPLLELREGSGVGRDGATAAKLLEVGRRQGLVGKGYRIEVERLRKGDLFPCILHWSLDHYVVAERAGDDGLILLDPNCGRRTAPWSEVNREFSGVVLRLQPGPEFRKRPRRRVGIRFAATSLRTILPTIAAVLGVGFAFDLLAFVFAAATSVFVDYVLPARSYTTLVAVTVAAGTIALARTVFVAARLRIVDGVRARTERDLGDRLLDRLLSLETPFFSKRTAGDLAARIRAVLELRDTLLSISQALFDLLLMVAYFGLLFAYDARLATMLLVVVGARIAVVSRAQKRLGDLAATEALARSDVSTVFVHAFAHVESVKAFRLESHLVSKLDRARGRELAALAAGRSAAAGYSALLSTLELGSTAALLLVGGRYVQSGAMSLGTLTSFLAVMALVSGRTAALSKSGADLARVGPTLDRLDDVLTARTEPGSGQESVPSTSIELREVDFAFEEGSPLLLRGVSFRVRPGEHVAIVGRSGSGKSTLLRLVAGLVRPSRGSISWGDRDATHLDTSELRRQVAFIPAALHTFEGTVVENVALESGASLEEVRRALAAMGLLDVLDRRPDGVLLRLARGRTPLSAGQAQRLLLARALVKKPRAMLLDEATSALDEKLEERVLAHLASQGATIVSVTHRRAVMKAAHRILVLDHGAIVDEGTFDELRARSAAFREVIA